MLRKYSYIASGYTHAYSAKPQHFNYIYVYILRHQCAHAL